MTLRLYSSLLLLCFCIKVYPCHLSDVDVTNYSFSAPNHTFDVVVCMGAGVDGADNFTSTFAIAFENGADPLNIVSVSPTSITGMFTGGVSNGSDLGPFATFNSEATYAFITTGTALTCIDNVAACGTENQECYTITFTMDDMPTSVTVYGIEGAGNVVAGCHPNLDMSFDFSTLPVELTDFRVESTGGDNRLTWQTTSEVNNDYFEVERSIDGKTFHPIGQVKGNGNSNQLHTYSYWDQEAFNWENYYRLKQVDFDGQFEYSQVVRTEQKQALRLYPNPTNGLVEMSSNFKDVRYVKVTNMTGKTVEIVYPNDTCLDLSHLIPGQYQISIHYHNGSALLSNKLIKI